MRCQGYFISVRNTPRFLRTGIKGTLQYIYCIIIFRKPSHDLTRDNFAQWLNVLLACHAILSTEQQQPSRIRQPHLGSVYKIYDVADDSTREQNVYEDLSILQCVVLLSDNPSEKRGLTQQTAYQGQDDWYKK